MKNTFQRVLAAAFVGAGVLGAGVLGGVSAALAAKDSLTPAMVLEPPHLDPTSHAAAAIDEVVYANIFEGLTRIDRNGAVPPALAASWPVSGDALTSTFKLPAGVTTTTERPDGKEFVRTSDSWGS